MQIAAVDDALVVKLSSGEMKIPVHSNSNLAADKESLKCDGERAVVKKTRRLLFPA